MSPAYCGGGGVVGAAGAAGLGELVGEELNGLELGELLPNPEVSKRTVSPALVLLHLLLHLLLWFTAAAPTTVLSFFRS